jgi:hypothetical protein
MLGNREAVPMRRRVAGRILVLILAVAALMLARLLAQPPGTSAVEGAPPGISGGALVLAAVVAWGLPVAAGWIAWHTARGSLRLLREGVRTAGQVVLKGSRVITIEYSAGGRTYRIDSSWRYVDQPMGAAVPVLYLESDPGGGCVAHWNDLWMPVFLWAAVAVFFAALDIWY